MVRNQIDIGKSILNALDAGGFPVRSAFWLRRSSIEAPEDWRLVLASSRVSELGVKDAYKQLQGIVLRHYAPQLSPFDVQQLIRLLAERVTLVSPSEQLVTLLRSAMGTPSNAVADIQLSNNLINNVLIEDAYIYRSS